jgi:hypothetical protein
VTTFTKQNSGHYRHGLRAVREASVKQCHRGGTVYTSVFGTDRRRHCLTQTHLRVALIDTVLDNTPSIRLTLRRRQRLEVNNSGVRKPGYVTHHSDQTGHECRLLSIA